MTAEWLRCSLVLEGVMVENPLRCCLCQFDDVYASGCRTASGMMSVFHTKLESFTNANDLSASFLALYHGYISTVYLGYVQRQAGLYKNLKISKKGPNDCVTFAYNSLIQKLQNFFGRR